MSPLNGLIDSSRRRSEADCSQRSAAPLASHCRSSAPYRSAGARARLGWAPRSVGGRLERGSTLVELALVFMVLATMMLGIIDFSRALYAYHFVSNVAREATRWASVNGYTCASDTSSSDSGGSCNGTGGMNNGPASSSQIQSYVAGRVPQGINPNQLKTLVEWPPQKDGPTICNSALPGYANSPYPNYPGCTVEVRVSYQFGFLYPIIHSSALTLSSTSEMVIAH